MGNSQNEGDPSFQAFMATVLEKVDDVNKTCEAITNSVVEDSNKEWNDYRHALDRLQDTVKKGQAGGHGKKAVKSCICEFVYDELPDGTDQQPLRIKAVRMRGWVKVSPAADDTWSSESSSSSASSENGGGGG